LVNEKNVKGRIWLIPVTLGGDNYEDVIPGKALAVARRLRHFIVEDLRSARRYLRLIDRHFPIDESVFYELNEHTADAETVHFLEPVLNGYDMGLMSEAGLPGIASSIIMALIASGMNGQNFTFSGYLPVKPAERAAKLRELEKKALEGYSQIFMEAPYRNQAMLESILAGCNKNTMLCIAVDITLPSESVRTMRVSEWKMDVPELKNRPVIFILQ